MMHFFTLHRQTIFQNSRSSRLVFFADTTKIVKNIQTTLDTSLSEKERQENEKVKKETEVHADIRNKVLEATKKSKIDEKIIEDLVKTHGKEIVENIVGTDPSLFIHKNTKAEVMEIITASAHHHKSVFTSLLKEGSMRDPKNKKKPSRAELKTLLQLPLDTALQTLRENGKINEKNTFAKRFFYLFSCLSPKDASVQKYIQRFIDIYGKKAITQLPISIRQSFIALHIHYLEQKNQLTQEKIQELSSTLHISIEAIVQQANRSKKYVLLSEQERVQEQFAIVQKTLGGTNPDLLLRLEKVMKEHHESPGTVMERIMEIIMAYLAEKNQKDIPTTLDALLDRKAEYELVQEMIQEILPSSKIKKYTQWRAEQAAIVEDCIQALQTQSYTYLATQEKSQQEIQNIEQHITFFSRDAKGESLSFGACMTQMHDYYIQVLQAMDALIAKKTPESSIVEYLEQNGMLVHRLAVRRYIQTQKISPADILSLQGFLPKHISLSSVATYIDTPLLYKTGLSRTLIQEMLGYTPTHETEKILSHDIASVATHTMTFALQHTTDKIISEAEFDIIGKTTNAVVAERYGSLTIEAYQETLQKANAYIVKIEKNIQETLLSADRKKQVLRSLEHFKKSLPRADDPNLPSVFHSSKQEFAKQLTQLRSMIQAEGDDFSIDSLLAHQFDDFWERSLSRLRTLAHLSPAALTNSINRGSLIASSDDVRLGGPVLRRHYTGLTEQQQQELANQQLFWEEWDTHHVFFSQLFALNEATKISDDQIRSFFIHQKKTKSPILREAPEVQKPYYDIQKKTIFLPASVWREVFASSAHQPISSATREIIFHECTHYCIGVRESLVPKSQIGVQPIWITEFDTMVRSEGAEKYSAYQELQKEFRTLMHSSTIDEPTDVSDVEEMMAIATVLLQHSPSTRRIQFSTLPRQKGHVVNDLITLLGENTIAKYMQSQIRAIAKERAKQFPTYFSGMHGTSSQFPANEDFFSDTPKAALQRAGGIDADEVQKKLQEQSPEHRMRTEEAKKEALAFLENPDAVPQKIVSNNTTVSNHRETPNAPMEENNGQLRTEIRNKYIKQYQETAENIEKMITEIESQIVLFDNTTKKNIMTTVGNAQKILTLGLRKLENEAKTPAEAAYLVSALKNKNPLMTQLKKEKEKLANTIDPESVYGQIQGIKKFIADFEKDDRNYFQHLWAGTEFLTISDFGQMGNTFLDYIKRQYQDSRSLRVNKVAKSLVPKWGWFAGLENEFSNAAEGAHSKIVKQYADGIDNETNSYIAQDFLPAVTNKEALRAGVEHLCKGGNMSWEAYGAIIGKKLKEFGSGITFESSDFTLDNEMLMRQKMKKAFNRVYGDETLFDKLYNQNVSANQEAINKGKDQMQSLGYAEDQIKEWMKQVCVYHPMGLKKEFYVKKQVLEGYILGVLEQGNFNPPQTGMYFMIMAIAQGAIQGNAAGRFWNSAVKEYPAFQKTSSKDRNTFIRWQKEILWDPELKTFRKPWENPPPWFDTWMDTKLMTDDGVVMNRMKQIDPTGYDHDIAYLNMSTGDADIAVKVLQSGKTYNGRNEKDNRFRSAPSGSMRFFSSLALHKDILDKEGAEDASSESRTKDILLRHASYYTAFQGLGTQSTSPQEYVFKFDGFMDEQPRATGKGYNNDMKIKDYFNAQNSFFLALKNIPGQDEGFIKFIDLVYGKGSRLSSESFNYAWNELCSATDANGYLKYPSIYEALAGTNVKIEGNGGRTADFFTRLAPRVLKYFLYTGGSTLTKAQVDQNVKVFLETIDQVSSGEGIPGISGSDQWMNDNYDAIKKHASMFRSVKQEDGSAVKVWDYPKEYKKQKKNSKDEKALAWNQAGEFAGLSEK